MTTDRLFVIMLVILIPMSGCFGTVDNADGDDGKQTIVNNYYYSNTTTNQLPVIFGKAMYTYPNDLVVRAVAIDYDGNITQCGIDVNLDAVIDFDSNCDDAHAQEVVHVGTSYLTSLFQYDDGACSQFASLIAVDNDGGKTIMPFRIFTEYDDENGVCTTNYENREA